MKTFAHPNEQLEIIMRGVEDLVEREELLAKLTRSMESGIGLAIMTGFDPSTPNLHMGHTVVLRKMRQFQELGHEVIFLIGDFTARIGDPSGQEKTRRPLRAQLVKDNASTYQGQISRILDPQVTRVEFNSSWLSGLILEKIIKMCARVPLEKMLSRPDLRDRTDIVFHELMYPLLQAYDSIHLKIDVEIGGLDQIPNLMLGRELMAAVGMEPQCILATSLLEGTDAHLEEGKIIGKKMSKMHDNTIDISESPEDIQLNDGLVWRYYELLTDSSRPQILAGKSDVEAGKRTMDEVRESLADDIIRMYHV
jgi:tyrosyl-tRNA synthetase